MPRGASTFRQRDAKALLKAALDAGVDVARVIVDRSGKIIIETNAKAPAVAEENTAKGELNEWDVVLSGPNTPKAL